MNRNKQYWKNATWKGSRIAQLKKSLELTPQERFEVLEDFAQISDWLARSRKAHHIT